MDIGNLNLFNKKKDENNTNERSMPTKGKEPASLNDMMHQVGDYDLKTSSTEQTKHSENSDNDNVSHESSKSSAKRAAVDAIATVASVIAPTTATASVAPPHNQV